MNGKIFLKLSQRKNKWIRMRARVLTYATDYIYINYIILITEEKAQSERSTDSE